MDRPFGLGQRVGYAARDVTVERSELENLTALARNLHTHLGWLLEQRAAGWQQHGESHIETGRDRLLQLNGDVEHQREKQRGALDEPVAGDQLHQANAHSVAAESAFRTRDP